jgi:hypothetical protein
MAAHDRKTRLQACCRPNHLSAHDPGKRAAFVPSKTFGAFSDQSD